MLVKRLVYSVSEAAQATTLNPKFLYQLIADGKLPVARVGRRVLIPSAALRQLVAATATSEVGQES